MKLFNLLLIPFVYGNIFFHISDIHLDLQYSENSPANCVIGDLLTTRCCRKNSIAKYPYRNASKWGDYNCDTPELLFNLTLSSMNKLEPNPDFIIMSGDIVGHHDLEQNWRLNKDTMIIGMSLIQSYFPNTLILSSIGNHDTYPIDQLYPNNIEYNQFIHSLWGRNSSYLYKIGNVTIVSLNTLYYEKYNIFKKFGDNGQFEWFENILKHTKNVWIIGHIFPFCEEATKEYSKKMVELIMKYNVKYQFWGHTHYDQFIIYPNKSGIGWIVPSVMPDKHASSFRMYEWDGINKITNYWNFVSNLSGNYEEYYNAKEEYNLDGMEIEDWIKIIGNTTLENRYCKLYNIDETITNCTKLIKQIII